MNYNEVAPFFFKALQTQINNARSMGQNSVERDLNVREQAFIKDIRKKLKEKGYSSKWKSPRLVVSWSNK